MAAVAAHGTTTFRDVGELAVKESDRLAATVALVEAVGGEGPAERRPTGRRGGRSPRPRAVRFDSGGDHRLAMAGMVAALASPGGGVVRGVAGGRHELSGASWTTSTTWADPGPGRRPTRPVTAVSDDDPAPLIAIDGPAGAGKSTVSRAVAERLGLDRLDTGAMYRSVAWEALQRGVDPADADAVAEIAADGHHRGRSGR